MKKFFEGNFFKDKIQIRLRKKVKLNNGVFEFDLDPINT